MKYCLRYRKENSALMHKADELIIKYNKKDITLPDFVNGYNKTRINILIEDNQEFLESGGMDKIKAISIQHPDQISLRLNLNNNNSEIITFLKENNISYYFNDYITDWDTLIGVLDLGVSDVLVAENICFELDKVAEITHSRNVKVRIYPNVAQSHYINSNGLLKFFIRPEDIIQYEPYVDICEFWGDAEKEDILYNVYAIDKQWFGDLNEIIIDLKTEIDSRFILPRFAENRIKCGKRCLKGSSCEICKNILKLSENLKHGGVQINMVQEISKDIDNDKNL